MVIREIDLRSTSIEEQLAGQRREDILRFGGLLGGALFELTHLWDLPQNRAMGDVEKEEVERLAKGRFASALVIARLEATQSPSRGIVVELAQMEYFDRKLSKIATIASELRSIHLDNIERTRGGQMP